MMPPFDVVGRSRLAIDRAFVNIPRFSGEQWIFATDASTPLLLADVGLLEVLAEILVLCERSLVALLVPLQPRLLWAQTLEQRTI